MNLLVNPPPAPGTNRYSPPPLGVLHLAAMDDETEIWDAALYGHANETLAERRPRIVGVPVFTAGRHSSLDVLREAKRLGAITVAGGPHVSTMCKQMVEHYGDFIDYFVAGDGEWAWQQICSGADLPRVIRHRVELDDLPLPAWEKIDWKSYPPRDHGIGIHRGNDLTVLPRLSVILGRGCTGKCSFCSAYWTSGRSRRHGKEWIARHLELLWSMGARHFVFQDDNFMNDRDAVLELCDILSQYTFSWQATARVDGFDREMAVAMQDCGCYEVGFGIESGSPEILRLMRKDISIEQSLTARNICKDLGLRFTALMMSGYPGENSETKADDASFRRELRPDGLGTIGVTYVFPGTLLYRQCKQAGLIDESYWLGKDPFYVYRGGLEPELLGSDGGAA